MAVLKFSPEADAFLTQIESDPRTEDCAGKLNTALDRLEENPGDAHNRRQRYQSIDLWGVSIRCSDDDILVLWGHHPAETEAVIVHYIGPPP